MLNILKNRFVGLFNNARRTLLANKLQGDILNTKNKKRGNITLFKREFNYHYGLAFYNTYIEIFQSKIYEFTAKDNSPVIIDCGANMGLSVLYFAKKYPKANIIAFEPDESVIPYLEKNIISQNLINVQLHKKAVWTEETELKFYTDNGLGGRIETEYTNQTPRIIKTVRLRDYLKEPIEMLKIDIEGAEFMVIEDCEDLLHYVKHIFIEYHSCFDEEQHLDDMLNILKQQGFRYHLRESFSRKKPFIDRQLVCEKFDMAINIFAYRNDIII